MARLRASGGYRATASFQAATLIYDATYWFREKFLDARSRTVDQMVQAARSGRQNLAEASRAAATSSQTELRLLNVARASLEELLLDFEDFLRHRRMKQWAADGPEAMAVREVPKRFKSDRPDPSDPIDLTDLTDPQRWALDARWLEHGDPGVRANAAISLIHQANYLLDQQIAAVEKQFVEQGGYSEQLAAARLAERQRKRRGPVGGLVDGADRTDPSDHTDPSDQPDPSDPIPSCPRCGKPMVLRTARKGRKAGRQLWGCTAYPDCAGAADV